MIDNDQFTKFGSLDCSGKLYSISIMNLPNVKKDLMTGLNIGESNWWIININ
jgi:hypothetical protein